MTRTSLLTLSSLTRLLVLVCAGCVEPPPAAAPACDDPQAQTICSSDRTNPHEKVCCETLNEVAQPDLLSRVSHVDYYTACVSTFKLSPERQKDCLEAPEDLDAGWDHARVVSRCKQLFNPSKQSSVEGEKLALDCITSLLSAAYASTSQEPYAITYFCDEQNLSALRNVDYQANCIATLAKYSWFPADPLSSADDDEQEWRALDNKITDFCKLQGSGCVQTRANPETMKQCLALFEDFLPERRTNTSPQSKFGLVLDRLGTQDPCSLCRADAPQTCVQISETDCTITTTNITRPKCPPLPGL